MKYLSEEDIIEIHSILIDKIGGSHGIRDRGTISSIVSQPKQNVFGEELYTNIYTKAAAYTRGIIFNHPFIDSNKRTAIVSAFVFLEDNNFKITAQKGEVEKFTLKIISEKLEIKDIASWLEENTKKLKNS